MNNLKIGDFANLVLNGITVDKVKVIETFDISDDTACIVEFPDGSKGKAWLRDLVLIQEEPKEEKTITREEFEKAFKKIQNPVFLQKQLKQEFDSLSIINIVLTACLVEHLVKEELFGE